MDDLHAYRGDWSFTPNSLKVPNCEICGQNWFDHGPGRLPLDGKPNA